MDANRLAAIRAKMVWLTTLIHESCDELMRLAEAEAKPLDNARMKYLTIMIHTYAGELKKVAQIKAYLEDPIERIWHRNPEYENYEVNLPFSYPQGPGEPES